MHASELSTELMDALVKDISFGATLRCQKFYRDKTIQTIFDANQSMPSSVLHRVLTKIPQESQQLSYLEIGSGLGISLIEGLKAGYDIKGLEPGMNHGFEGRYNFSSKLLAYFGFNPLDILYDSLAEKMTCFERETFDVVYSNQVLEHVHCIESVLKEAKRVLKSQGMIYMAMPHYLSYYEGHYHVFWLPYLLLNKSIAKYYIKMRKMDENFIDELNFITYFGLKKVAKKVFVNEKFYIMPHFANKRMGLLGALYYYQALDFKEIPDRKVFQWLVKNKLLNALSKPFVILIVHVLIVIGMAESLNLIYYKK